MNFDGFCVRLQAYDGYLEKVIMLQHCSDYQAIIAVKHFGSKKDNPHYHIVIKTRVKDQAFRVRMKKVFDMAKGNEHMSIKTWDGNVDAISYLFHENDSEEIILLRHNVSDETILKARERNREVRVKVEKAKQRASWTLEEEILQYYKSKPELYYDQYTIAKEIILSALRKDKYVPNDFLLKAMVTKIQFKLMDGETQNEEHFAKQLVARAYRMDYDETQRWLAEGGI